MAPRMSIDLRLASAVFLAGILLSAGCGSANGQATRTTTAVPAASAGPTSGAEPAGSRAGRSGDRDPSGIAGQTVAVVCGGPATDQGCPQRPVAATIDVLGTPSGRRVATVHTGNLGRFRLDLRPGTYKLEAHTTSQAVWARVVTMRVLPHQIRHTTITFVPRHPLPVAPGPASG